MPPIPIPEGDVDYKSQGEQYGQGLTEPKNLSRVGKMLLSVGQELLVYVLEYLLKNAGRLVVFLAKAITRGEDKADPVFRELTAAAVKDLTGANLSAGHAAIGKQIMEALSGGAGAAPGGQLAPSTAGAEAFMTTVMQLALEGYLEGSLFHALSLGYLEKFGELDDILANVLGIGRMSRAVMRPMMTARVITPMQWHVNKQYRPELLSPAELARQVARGRMTREAALEELARQGWSDARADALLSTAQKFFSAGDVRTFVDREHWDKQRGLQHLQDQGYTQAEAEDVLRLEGLRRIEQLEAAEATAIVTAYANRDIDAPEFHRLLRTAVQNTIERTFLEELGEVRRGVHVRFLSIADERRLVIAGIRSMVDFRRALEREGYVPEAVAALELELRAEQQAIRDLEEAKREQLAERAVEKQRQAEERAARLAAIAAEKALPSVADVRRAYVRGHVPIDRYSQAVQAAHPGISGDDLAALLADAELDRTAYLEALERREAAERQEADAVVPLGDVRQAVLRGVLTLEDFDRELITRGFDEAERRVLVAVLRAELEDRAAAATEREEARRRAAVRGVSLDAWERAVRLRVRTLEQYDAYLRSIETPELARALILDVLAAQLAQDDQARAKREASDATAARRGISLERRRRAVLMGVRDLDYYRRALVDAQLPVDDQRVELALLEAELADVAAARARRDEIAAELDERQRRDEAERAARAAEIPPPPPPTQLTLGQIERAVKLGLLPPDALRNRALETGYDPSDAELLVELAVFQIPDLRDGARRREAIKAELAAKRVSLDDLERAVLRGIRDLGWFEGELAGRGYGDDDVGLLTQLLSERTALEIDTLRRKIRAALEKAEGAPTLDELDQAIVSGTIGPDEARATLEAAGVVRDSALVYVRLLVTGETQE